MSLLAELPDCLSSSELSSELSNGFHAQKKKERGSLTLASRGTEMKIQLLSLPDCLFCARSRAFAHARGLSTPLLRKLRKLRTAHKHVADAKRQINRGGTNKGQEMKAKVERKDDDERMRQSRKRPKWNREKKEREGGRQRWNKVGPRRRRKLSRKGQFNHTAE